jgi:outer membrane lipoprotein-sorting protein
MKMRHTALSLILVVAGVLPVAWAQELTTQQVVAKLDEKAAAFTSLEASISQQDVSVYGIKDPVMSGKIYLKTSKSGPMTLLDISMPKTLASTSLIREGSLTFLDRAKNGYRKANVDPKSQFLQFVLIGFGSSSKTWSDSYSAAVKGREMIDKINTVVLELTSTSPTTEKFPKITLWLDPQAWTPVRTRVTKKSKDYTEFNYSNIKLNKGISDSVFTLDIPKNAVKL